MRALKVAEVCLFAAALLTFTCGLFFGGRYTGEIGYMFLSASLCALATYRGVELTRAKRTISELRMRLQMEGSR